ncbi:nitroreductase family protein [Pasteurella atlantica]|uniref:nitroreductase family protein n=1 Tax=Pasteurellaceae TaxID=712 RepID=UPI00276C76A4|nr:nitroreductase family protein [Pasteurella atlantica]MDP8098434.1 nitroreductase family protein [Pasteurella atlantica]MDP8106452.1 nitroreductase family protein [Pasteurella atlantica]MDP8116237.1 nitroreductase family protein [Pasteurella atlantica]
MKNNNFEDIVYNRTSIKVFDENIKIGREEMLEMLNKAVKAPSSVNLQPWRFVVVDTPEGKDILRPLIRFNTRQNDTSAAMIVLFGDMQCYQKAEDIYSRAVEKGLMPENIKQELMGMFVPFYENASKQKMNDIVKIDTSLMAMQLMLVARAYGYDTNAIGGFEEDKIAEALGVDPERYAPVMIIAIGKANYQSHGSIRLDAEEITTFK